MNRPKYKAMYMAAQKDANMYKERALALEKELIDARKTGLETAQERASIRSAWNTLFDRTDRLTEWLKFNLLDVAAEKNGWTYFPATGPDDMAVLMRQFETLRTYLDSKRVTKKP